MSSKPGSRFIWNSISAATPRLPDGKPNLTGSWRYGNKFFIWRYGNRRCSPTQLEGCSEQWNQTLDFEFEAAPRFGPNRPLYKPEHWDKVVYLDMWTNKEDPVGTCQPLGIPRQGPPGRLFHTEKDITMIYGRGGDGGGGYSDFRVIPTDNRPFDKNALRQTKYTGHSVGHWDGDTLVIESIGFVPETWLSRGGFFHSENMKVYERFTRKGDEMLYEVTVEDPDVLTKPWTSSWRTYSLGNEDLTENFCVRNENYDELVKLRNLEKAGKAPKRTGETGNLYR